MAPKTVGCMKPTMERWLAESPEEEPFHAQQSRGLEQTGQAGRGHKNLDGKPITPTTHH